jgi:hypothetical protein
MTSDICDYNLLSRLKQVACDISHKRQKVLDERKNQQI